MPRKREPVYETERYAFPSRLRELMKDTGTKQKDLAQALGVKPQTVSLYTQGQSFPDVNGLYKIASYFKVSADWLIGLPNSAKTIDADITAAMRVTGLSEDAIKAIEFTHSQRRQGEIFEVEDYLIREFYVSFIATQVRNCVKNIAEIAELGGKLGPDIVKDHTQFYKWRAISNFESALDGAIKELSSHWSNQKLMNKREFIAIRKKEYTEMLNRLESVEHDLGEDTDDGKH